MCVSRKVFLKHQVNWKTVCSAWLNICDNPVNKHLFLLVGRYVPTKGILMRNKNKPWFDDQCNHAFGLNQEAHLRWTRVRSRVSCEEFVRCQVEQMKPTRRQSVSLVTDTGLFLRMSSPLISGGPLLSPRCSALVRHCLLLVKVVDWCVGLSVRLTCCRIILTASSPCRDAVGLPLTCRSSPSLTTFAFRSREVRRLLSYLDPYGGTDPLGQCHFFLRKKKNSYEKCRCYGPPS